MALSQTRVRFRGSSLSSEEFEKSRTLELEEKNSWVRSACFQTVQERAGKTVVRDKAGFIEVPKDFVEPAALVKTFRRAYSRRMKFFKVSHQKTSKFNVWKEEGPTKSVDIELDILIHMSKNRPDLNDTQRQYLHDSINYWFDRSERKSISY